jgi:hypothetical protein
MGIGSWFGRSSRRKSSRRSLLRTRRDSPRLRKIREAAAADVATIREDDQYFDPNSPGNQPPY